MFDFGVPGYRPQWMTGLSVVMAAQGIRLAGLVGRRLSRVLVVWDPDEDEWFADGLVLLDFDGEQVEIVHQRFHDVSITWNTVDPAQPMDWAGEGFRLVWRDDAFREVAALEGQELRAVELLDWVGDDIAKGTVALSFVFPQGRITVYNALDENGIEFDPPDLRYDRHVVGEAEEPKGDMARDREQA